MTKSRLLFYCLFAFIFSLWLRVVPKGVIPVTHYRLADIQSGISSFPPLPVTNNPPVIRGGVVPHHLVAERQLARYFQNLSSANYTRVILVGPNHNNTGSSAALTTNYSWATPYGLVHPDQLPELPLDNEVMRSDHALEVLMPYLKLYLPKARVIPILLKATSAQAELLELVSTLKPFLNPTTLVLASTDFSHYLSVTEAQQRDQTTMNILKARDYPTLLRLADGNLDSPASVFILLSLLPSTNLEVFDHTSAALIANNPHTATTTHYFLNFYASE